MLRRPLALLMLASALAFAAGCGGDDDDTQSATTGGTTTTTATIPTTATAPDDAATAPAVANAADLDSKPRIATPKGSPPSTLVVGAPPRVRSRSCRATSSAAGTAPPRASRPRSRWTGRCRPPPTRPPARSGTRTRSGIWGKSR